MNISCKFACIVRPISKCIRRTTICINWRTLY